MSICPYISKECLEKECLSFSIMRWYQDEICYAWGHCKLLDKMVTKALVDEEYMKKYQSSTPKVNKE